MMNSLQQAIEIAFDDRANISPQTASTELIKQLDEVLDGLDSGRYRVAEKINDQWIFING